MGYEIIWESSGVIKRLLGSVSSADLIKSSAVIQSDSRFDDIKYVIVDFNDCTAHSVDAAALLEISAIDGAAFSNRRDSRMRNIKVAIVAVDPAILAMAVQSTDYAVQCVEARTFSSFADARTWLQLSSLTCTDNHASS